MSAMNTNTLIPMAAVNMDTLLLIPFLMPMPMAGLNIDALIHEY
jgi:hypothetical protein